MLSGYYLGGDGDGVEKAGWIPNPVSLSSEVPVGMQILSLPHSFLAADSPQKDSSFYLLVPGVPRPVPLSLRRRAGPLVSCQVEEISSGCSGVSPVVRSSRDASEEVHPSSS